MKKKWFRWLDLTAIFILAVIFVIKFDGPSLLRNYVESGIGNCQTIPVLCKVPDKEILLSKPDKTYIQECIPYKFPKVDICIPKGFKVVQELIKRQYYKKRKHRNDESVVYLLHQEPGYFCKIYPQVTKLGITNNYKFLKNIMFARVSQINNLNDAFFVIMKSIFTPDIGDQNLAKMIQIQIEDNVGFINYSLGDKINYFDCTIINKNDDFFKVYIKDTGKDLDLNKVISIISTVSDGEQSS